jgi:hypothetical protein
LHAATFPATGWEHRTFVLHAAPLRDLVDHIAGLGAHPSSSGCAAGSAWFVEEDLCWEPTAVAFTDPDTALAQTPLWSPCDTPAGRPSRSKVRDLARRAARDDVTPADIWAFAETLGDPLDRHGRFRAAHLLVKGREPP